MDKKKKNAKRKDPPIWLIILTLAAALALPLVPDGKPMFFVFCFICPLSIWLTKRYPLETKDSVDKQD